MIFAVKTAEENPYPPSVASLKTFLKKWGATDRMISQIAYENAFEMLRLPKDD
jgi:hypothetical protein